MKVFNQISLKKKWAASFLLILILPVIMNFVTYMLYRGDILNDYENINNRNFEECIHDVNLSLGIYRKNGAELGTNRVINDISNLNNYSELTSSHKSNFYMIWNIYSVDYTSSFLSFVYFSDSEITGDANGFSTANNIYKTNLSTLNISENEWIAWLNNDQSEFLYLKGPANTRNITPNYLAFKQVIFENRRGCPTELVMVFRDDFFTAPFKKIFDSKITNLDIVTKDKQLISTTYDNSVDNSKLYEAFDRTQGKLNTVIDKERVIATYKYDQANKWFFVFYTPKHEYYSIINKMTLIFLLGMCFSITLGIIIINIMVKERYGRVKQILDRIPESNENQDEYAQIEHMMLEIMKQEEKTLEASRKKSEKLFEIQMKQLLNGIDTSEDITKHPEFKYRYNSIIAFSTDDYTKLFKEEALSDIERYRLFLFILKNIGEEILIQQNIDTYFMQHNDFIIAILNSSAVMESLTINDCVNKIISYINEYFSISIKAYISKTSKGLDNLSELYRQALYCSEYGISVKDDTVIFYEDIEGENISNPFLIVDEGNKLNNYIHSGNAEKANEFTDNLINDFLRASNYSNEQLKYYINDIICHILRNFSDNISTNNNTVNDIYSLISMRHIDVTIIKKYIHTIIDEICCCFTPVEQKEDKSGNLTRKAKNYIKENYYLDNLSCSMIAEYCGVSNSYLSRLFKNIEKDGILNYINKTRISNSKRLLEDKNMRMEDVAKKVGILNVNTFIRLFKKYEGITPGTYKNSIQ